MTSVHRTTFRANDAGARAISRVGRSLRVLLVGLLLSAALPTATAEDVVEDAFQTVDSLHQSTQDAMNTTQPYALTDALLDASAAASDATRCLEGPETCVPSVPGCVENPGTCAQDELACIEEDVAGGVVSALDAGSCVLGYMPLAGSIGGRGACSFTNDHHSNNPTLNGVASWGVLQAGILADSGYGQYSWSSHNCEYSRLICNDGYYAARREHFVWSGSFTHVDVWGVSYAEFAWDNCQPGTKASASAAAAIFSTTWPTFPKGTYATGTVEGRYATGTAQVGGDIRSWTFEFSGTADLAKTSVAGIPLSTKVPVYVSGHSL